MSALVAFMPLFWATPATANQISLLEAQQQLVVAQQELSSASAALEVANSSVSAATIVRDQAQASYSAAIEEWSASRVTTPGTTSMASQNVVLNGNFDDASNWTNIGMGSNNTILNSNIPRVYNGVLIGSYNYDFILQVGNFPSPTRQFTFSYDMSNNNTNDGNRPQADGYRVEFRTYNAAGQRLNYYDTGNRADSFGWRNFTATYNLPDDAVRWDIGFRLVDNGFWNGNFAGSIDNVSLVTQVAVTTPETYTYGADETAAKDAASQALQSAEAALDSAIAAQSAATARVDAAIDEVVRLTNLVYDLTQRLLAPTNLTLHITEAGVQLSWTAPEPNPSGVMPERYAIGWSTTNFTENGWGWGHGDTSVTIPFDILRDYGGLGNEIQFRIRADNDTQSIYSSYSNVVATVVPMPEPQATPPTIPQGALLFSENQVAELVAPQYHRISNILGYYGDPNDSRNGLDVSSTLSQFVGSQSARIPATNEMFTDTAPGIPKILILLVTYQLDSALQTAAQEAARLEAIRLENERLAAEEAARVAAQQAAAAAAEVARLEAERVERERVAALEAAERLRQELLAAEAERARLAAEEAARLAAEEAARIAAEEAARLAAEEAAKLEAERIAAEEAAKAAAEEAERLEAERLEAERLEAERLAKLEAERLEAERLEAERVAAEEAAAEKAAEEEAERAAALEKAEAEEQARLEAEEKAREEAEANKPTPTEEPVVVEIAEPITAENIEALVEELATIAPQNLTTEQQGLIVEAALETFETAEQGSTEYEAALNALLVVAQADDIVLDEELAAIPLIGNVAGAAVEVFNALGNAGADMSPQVREQSEKVVVASVIVANIAITATSAATSAAAVAARRP